MRPLNRGLFLLVIFIIAAQAGGAQDRKAALEREKAEALHKITEAQKILEETRSRSKSSLGQLNAIKSQIEARNVLIQSYQREINLLRGQIDEDNGVIAGLEADLVRLRSEYAAMAEASYRTLNSSDRLAFLFSAGSFNQFLMRMKYMEQYAAARKNQVRLIDEVRDELILRRDQLLTVQRQRNALLQEQVAENEKQVKLRKEQDRVLADLRKKEGQLRREIEQRSRDVEKLEKLIAEAIRAEMKKASAAAKSSNLSIDLANLTASFEKNKTQLPWPVASGFISERFGTHPHPVYKGIRVSNDGINIQTKEKEIVRAVFNGTVKKIAVMPGMRYVVIVQHGNYYTVYARLREVRVKTGQEIAVNDVIGEVNTDTSGVSELQFQVWKNTTKLDPELWLTKR
jgi:murein hydrolase activator